MSFTFKTILTHFDSSAYAASRLRSAASLAELFDAHLIALYSVVIAQYGAPMVADGSALITQELLRLQAQKDQAARATFDRTAQGLLRNPEWRSGLGDPARVVSEHARYADLIVLGQYAAEESNDVTPDFVGRVITSSGRPVLVIPTTTPARTLGARPLVAWNGSREAARAVTAALPLLQRARSVQIATFNNPNSTPDWGAPAAIELATFLARHGVQAQVLPTPTHRGSIGEQILAQAQTTDADLIVMGGYGRARAFEFIMGGATRSLLDTMTVPVLFAH